MIAGSFILVIVIVCVLLVFSPRIRSWLMNIQDNSADVVAETDKETARRKEQREAPDGSNDE